MSWRAAERRGADFACLKRNACAIVEKEPQKYGANVNQLIFKDINGRCSAVNVSLDISSGLGAPISEAELRIDLI